MKPDGSSYSVGTWYESDCNELTLTGANGTSHLTNLAGSLDSGIFTFREIDDDGSSVNVSCVLVSL